MGSEAELNQTLSAAIREALGVEPCGYEVEARAGILKIERDREAFEWIDEGVDFDFNRPPLGWRGKESFDAVRKSLHGGWPSMDMPIPMPGGMGGVGEFTGFREGHTTTEITYDDYKKHWLGVFSPVQMPAMRGKVSRQIERMDDRIFALTGARPEQVRHIRNVITNRLRGLRADIFNVKLVHCEIKRWGVPGRFESILIEECGFSLRMEVTTD